MLDAFLPNNNLRLLAVRVAGYFVSYQEFAVTDVLHLFHVSDFYRIRLIESDTGQKSRNHVAVAVTGMEVGVLVLSVPFPHNFGRFVLIDNPTTVVLWIKATSILFEFRTFFGDHNRFVLVLFIIITRCGVCGHGGNGQG
jgi:hypothetical protein